MSTKLDKALTTLNATNGGGVLALAYALLVPITDKIDGLEAELAQVRANYARVCDVTASYMKGRGADKNDDADTAADVVNRYVVLAEYEALSPANSLRMQSKQGQVLQFNTRAKEYRDAAQVVCDYPGAAID